MLAVLLSTLFCLNFRFVNAQSEPNLAETINNVVSNIQDWSLPWTVLYGQIFGVTNQSSYDTAILQALNQSDYVDVVFIATLSKLNGYSSTIVNNSVFTALENMPMCGSLPITYDNSSGIPNSFCVYDRYLINAYQYAQELGVSGWNITQAFLDFANAYLQMPIQSQHGEMLWINPALNFSEAYSSRFYDEYAETLNVFLMFAEAGVNATVAYNGQTLSPINFADDMWLNVQNLWTGDFYSYAYTDLGPLKDTPNAPTVGVIECEMGNFAQIITEYQNYRGNITYFNRVIQNLEYTLLAENFSSPIWSSVGVLTHATDNSQQRLEETTGAIIALQMLYPDFSSTMKGNFEGMLQNGMWQGLLNSGLFSNNQFQFDDCNTTVGSGFSDDASSIGAMTLFLDVIVPGTGYLAMNASNEAYQDYRTCFPTSEWSFNYQTQTITIPVMAGTLSFIFGTQEVTQNFPSNGVYNIQFADNWNSIKAITQIASLNSVALQPVTLQTILRPTSTPTPTTTTTPIPTSTPTSTATVTPTPAPLPTSTKNNTALMQTYDIPLIISAVVVMAIVAVALFKKK
jgi:hypothetical protein